MTEDRRWAAVGPAVLLLAASAAGRPAAQAPAEPPRARVSFNHEIRPLLSDRCFRCHGPDERARKAKMRLDTPEGAHRALDDGWFVIKPGDPSRSFLVEKIFETDPDEMMPPPESHLTLSDDERRLLVRWIEQGAELTVMRAGGLSATSSAGSSRASRRNRRPLRSTSGRPPQATRDWLPATVPCSSP